MLLKKLVKLHIKKQMNKRLFYKDNLRYNVKRCIIFFMEEKILGFITSLFGKKQYVCPFCHEHYTFSAMHARKLADKDGQIHCYYCRKVLQQLH